MRRNFTRPITAALSPLALAFVLATSSIVVPSVAHTQESTPVSRHKDWTVHTYGSGEAKRCFMTSTPTELKGNYNRNNRGKTRVYVSHGPDKSTRNVVTVFAGYRYKSQTDVTFDIDGETFRLYSDGTFAWAYQEEDQALVRAMRSGQTLTVIGVSSRGNETIDTYSLAGFTAAHNEISQLCPA